MFPFRSLGLAGLGSFELGTFEPWPPNKGLFCLEPDEEEVGLFLDAVYEQRLCCGEVNFELRGTSGGGILSLSALLALPWDDLGLGGTGKPLVRLGEDAADGILG